MGATNGFAKLPTLGEKKRLTRPVARCILRVPYAGQK